jgi:hypothetical protein
MAIVVHGCNRLDGDRWLSEGWWQHYLANFPFMMVWTTAGAALVLALVSLARRERPKLIIALVLSLSLLIGLGFWRSFENSGGRSSRAPSLRWWPDGKI